MTLRHKLTLATPDDRTIVMTRAFDAPRALVFDALTTPALLQRWMLGPEGGTMPVCEVDLRVGGVYRFVLRWGAEELVMHGVYRAIEPPGRLVHTEIFEPWPDSESVITTVLTERDGVTTMVATVVYPSREARDGIIASGMEEGAAASYDRLDTLFGAR